MEHTARVGLGPIDRIAIVLAWLVSCAAVYGLGFYTGSHTHEPLRGDEERIVRLPVADEPPPVGQRSKTADDLTFWTALEPGGQRAKPGEGIPAARLPVAAPAASGTKPEVAPAKPRPAARPLRASAAGRTANPPKVTGRTRKTAVAATSGRSAAAKRPASGAPAAAVAPAASAVKSTPVAARPRSTASRSAQGSAGPGQTKPPARAPAAVPRTPAAGPRAAAAARSTPPRPARERAAGAQSAVVSE
jgi:hypothetical protein